MVVDEGESELGVRVVEGREVGQGVATAQAGGGEWEWSEEGGDRDAAEESTERGGVRGDVFADEAPVVATGVVV